MRDASMKSVFLAQKCLHVQKERLSGQPVSPTLNGSADTRCRQRRQTVSGTRNALTSGQALCRNATSLAKATFSSKTGVISHANRSHFPDSAVKLMEASFASGAAHAASDAGETKRIEQAPRNRRVKRALRNRLTSASVCDEYACHEGARQRACDARTMSRAGARRMHDVSEQQARNARQAQAAQTSAQSRR